MEKEQCKIEEIAPSKRKVVKVRKAREYDR